MTNENVEKWGQFLDRLVNSRPNAMHNSVVSIAEACVDQMKDLMPGCKVRIIIDQADIETHENTKEANWEKIVMGSGVIHTTKVSLDPNDEQSYLLLTTETNND